MNTQRRKEESNEKDNDHFVGLTGKKKQVDDIYTWSHMAARGYEFYIPLERTDHYRVVAERYDYLYKEVYEGIIPVLMKSLNLKPEHVVADIGSGTGYIAEKLFHLSGLSNPIWCVDPSIEMQEVARQRKGLYAVHKTAEDFFSDPQISESFDRVLSITSAHHFINPNAIYKGIFCSLRPGGIFIQLNSLSCGHPAFLTAEKLISESLERERETQFSVLQAVKDIKAKVSQQEFSFPFCVTKSKLYEMFRYRYGSMLRHFSDDQIEEGIRELENEVFKDMKDDDVINYDDRTFLMTKVEKVG